VEYTYYSLAGLGLEVVEYWYKESKRAAPFLKLPWKITALDGTYFVNRFLKPTRATRPDPSSQTAPGSGTT
jgi:hypothetical protein